MHHFYVSSYYVGEPTNDRLGAGYNGIGVLPLGGGWRKSLNSVTSRD